MRWFFTFGVDGPGGLDGYVEVRGSGLNWGEARSLMVVLYGTNWSSQYEEDEWDRYVAKWGGKRRVALIEVTR